MKKDIALGILGGDKRQVFLAKALAADGFKVFVSALGAEDKLNILAPDELIERCTHIILPLPATVDGKSLNAPDADESVILDDSFAARFKGKTVLAGMAQRLIKSSPVWKDIKLFDYYSREELLQGNAYLTAEGAIGEAIRLYEGSLSGSDCLVCGFGRIGKALSSMLKGMGARVSCAARSPKDLTVIKAMGFLPVDLSRSAPYVNPPKDADLYEIEDNKAEKSFDLIFNTVPALVIDRAFLTGQSKAAVIFELASSPGGVDIKAAKELGIRLFALPSLPGRLSPKAAGELLEKTVLNILRELQRL